MGSMGMMDDGDMPMMGSGMVMMGGGMGQGSCGMLDLSAEQRTKINKIQDDLRKQHWAVMGKMMDEQAKLRDLIEAIGHRSERRVLR